MMMEEMIMRSLYAYGISENAFLVSANGLNTRLIRKITNRIYVVSRNRSSGEQECTPDVLLPSQLLYQIEEGNVRIIPYNPMVNVPLGT